MTCNISIIDLLVIDDNDYSLKKNKLIDYNYEFIEKKLFNNSDFNLYVNKKNNTIIIISSPTNKFFADKLLHFINFTKNEKLLFFKDVLIYIKNREIDFNKFISKIKKIYPRNEYQYVFIGFSLGSYLQCNVFEKDDIVYFFNPFLTPYQVFSSKFSENSNYKIFRTRCDCVSSFTELNTTLNIHEIIPHFENENTIGCQQTIHCLYNFKDIIISLP